VVRCLFEEVAAFGPLKAELSTHNDNESRIRDVVTVAQMALELHPPPSNETQEGVWEAWQDFKWLEQRDEHQRKRIVSSVLRRAISIMSFTLEERTFAAPDLNYAVSKISTCYSSKLNVPSKYAPLFEELEVATERLSEAHGIRVRNQNLTPLSSSNSAPSKTPKSISSCLAIRGALLCSIAISGADILEFARLHNWIPIDDEIYVKGKRDVYKRFQVPEIWHTHFFNAKINLRPNMENAMEEFGILDASSMKDFFYAIGNADLGSKKPTLFTKLHALFSSYVVDVFLGTHSDFDVINALRVHLRYDDVRLEKKIPNFLRHHF